MIYTYIAQHGDLIKVGSSRKPVARMSNLKYDFPKQTEGVTPLLFAVATERPRFKKKLRPMALESWSHKILAPYSVGREWFRCPPGYALDSMETHPFWREGYMLTFHYLWTPEDYAKRSVQYP